MVVRMGTTSVGRICMEMIWTHTTSTSLAVPILVDACTLKLIGELKKPILVDACSLKLIGELMIRGFSLPEAH